MGWQDFCLWCMHLFCETESPHITPYYTKCHITRQFNQIFVIACSFNKLFHVLNYNGWKRKIVLCLFFKICTFLYVFPIYTEIHKFTIDSWRILSKLSTFTSIAVSRNFTMNFFFPKKKHLKVIHLSKSRLSALWSRRLVHFYYSTSNDLTSVILFLCVKGVFLLNCTYNFFVFMKSGMSTKPVTDTLPNLSACLKGEFYSISSCNMSSANQYNSFITNRKCQKYNLDLHWFIVT